MIANRSSIYVIIKMIQSGFVIVLSSMSEYSIKLWNASWLGLFSIAMMTIIDAIMNIILTWQHESRDANYCINIRSRGLNYGLDLSLFIFLVILTIMFLDYTGKMSVIFYIIYCIASASILLNLVWKRAFETFKILL